MFVSFLKTSKNLKLSFKNLKSHRIDLPIKDLIYLLKILTKIINLLFLNLKFNLKITFKKAILKLFFLK